MAPSRLHTSTRRYHRLPSALVTCQPSRAGPSETVTSPIQATGRRRKKPYSMSSTPNCTTVLLARVKSRQVMRERRRAESSVVISCSTTGISTVPSPLMSQLYSPGFRRAVRAARLSPSTARRSWPDSWS